MSRREDPPTSGVFRVMYFLVIGVVLLLVVVSAVVSFYDPPSDSVNTGLGFQVQSDHSRENYNRNVSLILQITSAGIFATAIFGLGSRFNPLRSGLMLGGLGIYLIGVGFWATASDQWLGFLTTVVNFVVLCIGILWLEEGLPLGPTGEVRRLQIPPTGGAAGVPAPVAPQPVPPPPPPPPPQPYSSHPAPGITSSTPEDMHPAPGGEPPGQVSQED